jgi:integrase
MRPHHGITQGEHVVSAKEKEDRGWNVYRRKTGSAAGRRFLQYRRAPGDWTERRVPAEFPSQRQAERWAAAWYAEWTAGRGNLPIALEPDTDDGQATIKSLSDRWLDVRDADATIRPATKLQSHSCMKIILRDPIASRPLLSLGWEDFEAWVERTAKDRASFTTRNITNTMSRFLGDCIDRGWVKLPQNFMRNRLVTKRIPPPETVAAKHGIDMIVFTRSQVETLLTCPKEKIPDARRTRYFVAALTGLRDGEVSGLTWADVHADAEIPYVDVTKAVATHGAEGWATVGKLKTKGSKRKVPLHPQALAALKAWRAKGWVERIGRAPTDVEPVFPGVPMSEHEEHVRARPFRPASSKLLRIDLGKAGLPKDFAPKHPFTFHALRRFFATMLTDAGVSGDTIDALLGHLDEGTSAKHYIGGDHLRRASDGGIKKLPSLDLTSGVRDMRPMRAVGG